MLILTRRIGESIIINDNITITLLDNRQNQAKIGIDAPLDIAVYRDEIYDKRQAEKQTKENK